MFDDSKLFRDATGAGMGKRLRLLFDRRLVNSRTTESMSPSSAAQWSWTLRSSWGPPPLFDLRRAFPTPFAVTVTTLADDGIGTARAEDTAGWKACGVSGDGDALVSSSRTAASQRRLEVAVRVLRQHRRPGSQVRARRRRLLQRGHVLNERS